jgi:hypothetical protein
VATNTGADIHGREIQRACCGFGFHPGGRRTSTSDVTVRPRPRSAARPARRTRRQSARASAPPVEHWSSWRR